MGSPSPGPSGKIVCKRCYHLSMSGSSNGKLLARNSTWRMEIALIWYKGITGFSLMLSQFLLWLKSIPHILKIDMYWNNVAIYNFLRYFWKNVYFWSISENQVRILNLSNVLVFSNCLSAISVQHIVDTSTKKEVTNWKPDLPKKRAIVLSLMGYLTFIFV